jgi:hypothetical protein
MAYCYHCGEEIEFINNGFGPIPIHPSGSCSGRGGGYGGGGGGWIRPDGDGGFFEFPFVTYPSYVNPNARCPVCGADVYFYQSPYGGRVFFDELGPPWPKHPCTDNPVVRQHFSSAESRAKMLKSTPSPAQQSGAESAQQGEVATHITALLPSWAEAGWMPFVVTKIVPRLLGIEVEGKLFESSGEPILFRIVQESTDARYYRIEGQIRIGCDLIQNASRILSVLNECPILLKKDPDLQHLILSSFFLTRAGGVQEIALSVNGTEIIQPSTTPLSLERAGDSP